jgi:hypothetical protein
VAAVPVHIAPYAGDLFAAHGWPRERRMAFINSLHDPSFSPDRQVMLERLLGEFGDFIAPDGTGPDGSIHVEHLPAGPDGLHELGSTVIHVPGGVIWIDDASAYFQDKQGQRYQIHQDQAIDPTGGVITSSVAVAQELDSIHSIVGPSFNSTQAAVVAGKLLKDPPRYQAPLYYGHATPPPQDDPLNQPHMTGNTFAYGNFSTCYILPDGRQTTNIDHFDVNTGIYTPPAPNVFMPYTPAMVDGMEIDAFECIPLALMLIAVSVLLLLGNKHAAVWSVRYAWLKLVQVTLWLAFTAGIMLPRMASRPNAPTGFVPGLYFGGIVVILFQMAYPIAILISLRTRSTQWFFSESGVNSLPARFRIACGPTVRGWMTSIAGRVFATAVAIVAGWLCAEHLKAINGPSIAQTTNLYESSEFHGLLALFCAIAALVCLGNWAVKKPEKLLLLEEDA